MRSVRGCYLALVVSILMVLGARAEDKLDDAATRARLEELRKSNNLDEAGAAPWHLRLSYELRDAYGDAVVSKGVIEEWWASPERARITIESPLYHYSLPDASDSGPLTANRERFLTQYLLRSLIHPASETETAKRLHGVVVKRSFGEDLSCLRIEGVVGGPPGWTGLAVSQLDELCIIPGSNVIRVEMGRPAVIVHNRVGNFRGINVPLEATIAYNGKSVITGRLEKLESFDPDSLTQPFGSPKDIKERETRIVPGHPLGTFVRPAVTMLESRGSIVVSEVVGIDGKVHSSDVIASPDRKATDAILSDVRVARFTPFTRNGQPVEALTTWVFDNTNR